MGKFSLKSFLPVAIATTFSITTLTNCGQELVPANNAEINSHEEEAKELEKQNEPKLSKVVHEEEKTYGLKYVAVVPTYIKDDFEKKEKSVGAGLGRALSNIEKIPNGTGYIRYYAGANGAGAGVIIYNLSKATAYWVHGAIYGKWIKDGGINKYGLPKSDEIKGITSKISGADSVYQEFNAWGSPTIQYNNNTGEAFVTLEGIRGFWLNNVEKLGLPKSDEMTNPARQKFEGGTVLWNNGKPYIEGTNTDIKFPAPNFNSPFYGSKNHIIARNNWSYKGECTWYVDGRLQELGLYPSSISSTGFIGHAKAWKTFAESKGLIVGKTPRVGSVMVSTSGLHGHVAFTEKVNADGSFVITESNLHGNNKYNGERKVSSVNSTTYFIYLK